MNASSLRRPSAHFVDSLRVGSFRVGTFRVGTFRVASCPDAVCLGWLCIDGRRRAPDGGGT
jgi:hypothetical protein